MIILKNRELLIPNNERYIGTTQDNESENRLFRIDRLAQNGQDLSDLTFRLDLKYPAVRNVYTFTTSTSRTGRTVVVKTILFTENYPNAGTYTFTFSSGTGWSDGDQVVDLDEIGVAITFTPNNGDTITVVSSVSQVTTDTVLLDKQITDDYIYLAWAITANNLAVPGTVFVSIRGVNADSVVRWASFPGVFYAETNEYMTPQYSGNLSELQQLESALVEALRKAEGLSGDYADLEAAIEDAEAWARGTKGGIDVGSDDDTYHNNAKYHADQASASATAALGSQHLSEAYAKGTVDGTAVEEDDPGYHDNAKYYKEQVDADAAAIAASRSQIATNATNIAAQTARIDSFVALADGSTTGDAELQDIRVGQDGTTYNSAGTAVRSQVGDLKTQLDLLSQNIHSLSNISDEVREKNLFEGTQYPTPKQNNGVTVTNKYYSGVHVIGTIATQASAYINRALINLESGKTYTMYVTGDNLPDGIMYSIKTPQTAGAIAYTGKANAAYTFTVDADYSGCYMYLYRPASLDSVNIDSDIYVLFVEGEYSNIDFDFENAINEPLSQNLHYMSNISDEVRNKNLFEGTQYPTPRTNNGITVTNKYYSGVHATGTLASGTTVYINRAIINLESGKTYTMYVIGNDLPDGLLYSIRNEQTIVAYTEKRKAAYSFTADADYTKCYVYIYCPAGLEAVTLDNDIYVLLVEGEYSNMDFDFDATANEQIDLLTQNLHNLSNISDEVREENLFEGTQYPTPNTNHGITVTNKYYSGVHVSGTLTAGSAAYISQALITLESGKTYTMYVSGDNLPDGVYYSIQNAEMDSAIAYTGRIRTAYTFTVDTDYSGCYVYLYRSANLGDVTLDNDIYILLAEGEYTNKDFNIADAALIFDAEKYRETTVRQGMIVGLPILYLQGSTAGMSKDNKVNLEWEYKGDGGACTMKWQGASSQLYEKKNYTITLDHAINVGWGAQKKYCLKANFIDTTHAMNICSARLWSAMVADRDENPCVGIAPNNGAMDGFPIIIMLNGEFHGLYTWNIPKDKWAFGMGSGSSEYIVTSEVECPATYFKAPALLDTTDFELEYAPDEVELETVRTALNNAINAVINATGANWENAVNPYIDVNSAIDYMILVALTTNNDALGHNYILTTYNGVKWWLNSYDMDAVFGNHWTGSYYLPIRHSRTTFAGQNDIVRLHHLIYRYSKEKLIERYNYLRTGIMSEDNIHDMFENFSVRIPEAIQNADYEKYPTIPGTHTQTLARILENYRLRCAFIDKEIQNLGN